MSRSVLIDVAETTVFAKRGAVVELRIVICQSSTVFDELIRPDVLIHSTATHVHGIFDVNLEVYRRRNEINDNFRRLLAEFPLVFFSAAFDKRFLIQTIG